MICNNIYYHITEKSSNRKTGPIPVISSSHNTCSKSCPFKNNGCYGDGGPLRLHWSKVSNGLNSLTFEELLDKIIIIGNKVKKII